MENKPDKCEQGECDKADVSETQYDDPNKANEEEYHPRELDSKEANEEEKQAKDKRKETQR